VVSHYQDGVFIWNIADTKKPILAAYYDTYPQNSVNDYTKNFTGCWGVWPYLPSGNIIASDRTNGIFVLKADSGLLSTPEIKQSIRANIYPNPSNEQINISIETNYNDAFKIQILNLQGQIVKELVPSFKSNYLYTENINDLKNGLYIIEIIGSKNILKQKFWKQ
jgi:hypothetical protein